MPAKERTTSYPQPGTRTSQGNQRDEAELNAAFGMKWFNLSRISRRSSDVDTSSKTPSKIKNEAESPKKVDIENKLNQNIFENDPETVENDKPSSTMRAEILALFDSLEAEGSVSKFLPKDVIEIVSQFLKDEDAEEGSRAVLQACIGVTGFEVTSRVLASLAPPPEPRPQMSEADLAEFLDFAKANPWKPDEEPSPSSFIKKNFERWFDQGLSLDVIALADPELVRRYKEEIVRNTRKRIKALNNPHKLPLGAGRPLSVRLVAELSPQEVAEKRRKDREYKQRSRSRKSHTPN